MLLLFLIFNPNSLIVFLASESVPNSSDNPFECLIDSGSTHCFIESAYVRSHKIPTRSIPPIPLKLFDGSMNSVLSPDVEGVCPEVVLVVRTIEVEPGCGVKRTWLQLMCCTLL